jgi:RNA polymerase sigma-70 factor (ECF subfamily)
MESITAATRYPAWHDSRKPISRGREESLIDSTLRGCREDFWDLIEPHLNSVRRIVRMRLRSDNEAEDVVQQAVLRAFSHLRQFRGEASFKTWLSAIAFNEVSHLRRGRALAAVQPLNEVRAAELPDPSHAPDMQLQRQQEIERLHQALTRLPEKYRLMIQLRDLRELSVAETAHSLSLSAAAVKTRHHRARKLLVRSLTRVAQAA